MTRTLPSTWTASEQTADREIYDFLQGWLKGTALSHHDAHMMTESGHLVWRDLVDKFLARTPQRRQAIDLELKNATFNDKKESIPQFFARLRLLQLKLKAVGGHSDEISLVMVACSALRAHSDYMRGLVDNIIDAKEEADTYHLESKLLQKMQLDKVSQEKRKDTRARAAFMHAEVQQAIARVEANMAEPKQHQPNRWSNGNAHPRNSGTHGVPYTHQRPWERPTRDARDKTGIGFGNNGSSNGQRTHNWTKWKGQNKESALAQLSSDYEAQVAEVEKCFQQPQSTAEPAATNVFEAGMEALCEPNDSTANFEVDELYSAFSFEAPHPQSCTHVVLSADSQQRLLSSASSEDPAVDSGTTHNIWRNVGDIDADFQPCHIPITHAGGKSIYAEGRGTAHKELLLPSGRTVRHAFTNSLFVPGASRDLISTAELENQGHAVLFKKGASAIVLESGVRIPLNEQGRLRTIPLYHPTAPTLRQGWTSAPLGWTRTDVVPQQSFATAATAAAPTTIAATTTAAAAATAATAATATTTTAAATTAAAATTTATATAAATAATATATATTTATTATATASSAATTATAATAPTASSTAAIAATAHSKRQA